MRTSLLSSSLALFCMLSASACSSDDTADASTQAESEASQTEASQTETGDDTGTETGDDTGLAGESCDYFCAGVSCNLRCEEGVLYRCRMDNIWHFEQDCAAEGLVCVLSDPNALDAVYECAEP